METTDTKIKIVTASEIAENDFILSADYYISILPELEKEHIFKNPLSNQTARIKLNLKKLDAQTKLFIYDLLKARERLNKIRAIERGMSETLKDE